MEVKTSPLRGASSRIAFPLAVLISVLSLEVGCFDPFCLSFIGVFLRGFYCCGWEDLPLLLRWMDLGLAEEFWLLFSRVFVIWRNFVGNREA